MKFERGRNRFFVESTSWAIPIPRVGFFWELEEIGLNFSIGSRYSDPIFSLGYYRTATDRELEIIEGVVRKLGLAERFRLAPEGYVPPKPWTPLVPRPQTDAFRRAWLLDVVGKALDGHLGARCYLVERELLDQMSGLPIGGERDPALILETVRAKAFEIGMPVANVRFDEAGTGILMDFIAEDQRPK